MTEVTLVQPIHGEQSRIVDPGGRNDKRVHDNDRTRGWRARRIRGLLNLVGPRDIGRESVVLFVGPK